MTESRVFTEDERRVMGARSVDLIQAAIDAGDYDQAKRYARRMYADFLSMHDLLCTWTTALLTFIHNRFGEDVLYEALRESVASWLKPYVYETYAGADARRRAQLMAAGLRGHLQPIEIEEDDEKVILKMQPCGSGGRLILKGQYEARDFARVQNPHPFTYGRADFPIFCTHCPMHEILPVEWTGVPWAVTIPAEKLGEEPCQFYVYKDQQAVPAEMYERLGLLKGET